ncbi:hypothetical protein [Paraburkholderia humisilvae]|uniref:Uncharacterized protein n=1 Tax=Paraburkholderia humisilvae TaxID=627669 RepID=A0A6J5ECT7_9BURK|nr:hypothetical protein [Paraburkholderia humisilvae]CAB3762935.1 hypothetical protein LMG29542_04460 [Paraburkholderia humisilvae]
MNRTPTQNNNQHIPYFSLIPTYVLVRPGENGGYQVCGDGREDGASVGCYLSPLHALIEAEYNALTGRQYDVAHAGWIDPQVFRTADGKGLTADLRLGWPVRDGKILLRQDGGLASFARRMVHSTNTSTPPPYFEIDQEALDYIDSLHERAGLFAWREAYRNVTKWSSRRVTDVVTRAVASMKVTEGDISRCVEAALFDPEFEQWHIVPYAVLIG